MKRPKIRSLVSLFTNSLAIETTSNPLHAGNAFMRVSMNIHRKRIHAYAIFAFSFDSQTVINEAENWSILLEHLPKSSLKQKM